MANTIIYLVQCTLNPKLVYIGKTKQSLEIRKKQHIRDALNQDGLPFHIALIEEGLKNWNWRIIDRCSEEDAFKVEKNWIKKHNALPIDLLNATHKSKKKNKTKKAKIRTQSINNGTITDIQKLLIEDGLLKPIINLNSGAKYKSLSKSSAKEVEDKLTIKRACETGKPTKYGNRFAYLDKDGDPIMTEGHLKKIGRRKKVKNIDDGKIFNNANEASKYYSVSASNIQEVCRGAQNTSKNYIFCYLDFDGNEVFTKRHTQTLKNRNKKFAVYSIDDLNLENPVIFSSTKEIADKYKINSSHILSVCRGERQHTKGLRIAFWNSETKKSELTPAHKSAIKKAIRKVLCLGDKNIFDSPKEAGKYYKINSSQIILVCKGKLSNTANKRFAFLDSFNKPILTELHNKKLTPRSKGRIRIYCHQTQKEYKSLTEFCNATGVHIGRARRHLKDSLVNLGGFSIIEIE